MKGNIVIDKKVALFLTGVISLFSLADFVSLVDTKSAGGVIVEQEQVPIGTVSMWLTGTPPDGWIEIAGQSTAAYPELAKIVGSTLPDYRGEFLRGWDNGRGIDSGRLIGSFQAEQIPEHKHATTFIDHSSNVVLAAPNNKSGAPFGTVNLQREGPNGRSYTTTPSGDSTSTSSNFMLTSKETFYHSGETRVRNVSVMYIIKAENK